MRPNKDDEALVDVLDVLLRDGAIVRADVIVSVADIPLIGIKLTAAIAGMETMTDYGLFEEWDLDHRRRGITRRGDYDTDQQARPFDELETTAVGSRSGRDELASSPGNAKATGERNSSNGRTEGTSDEAEDETEE